MRIILVPQFPSKMRYQEWWFTEFPKQFRERGFEVLVLGEDYINKIKEAPYDPEVFSPMNQAIFLETLQINEYLDIDLRDDDVLFWMDLSFPGLFGHVLFHKRPKKMYAFCHATAKNFYDYYEPDRMYKFPIETSLASMFDKVFVGSKYHKAKLGWKNTVVTYLPFPPMRDEVRISGVTKTIDIMSASRPSIQKVDSELEKKVEEFFKVKIKRPKSYSWFNYFWNLNSAKILLITAREDTFGYQIVDAVMNNCIPLARRSFAYPELLPNKYLYSSEEELFDKIDHILNGDSDWIQVPKLLCEEQMNKFYDTICDEILNSSIK